MNRTQEDQDYLLANDKRLAEITAQGKAPEQLTAEELDYVQKAAGFVNTMANLSPAEKALYNKAVASGNLWVRRVAMLHQLGWRDETDRERLFGYALTLAGEEDFFIRKAIGWALRDCARHAPAAVGDFLAGAGRVLSPLSRRQAGKHLAMPQASPALR